MVRLKTDRFWVTNPEERTFPPLSSGLDALGLPVRFALGPGSRSIWHRSAT